MWRARYPREPIQWPRGARMAILATYDYQAEVGLTAVPGAQVHSREISDRQYGAHEGLERVLRLHREYDIPATFRLPGQVAELYPDTVRAIQKEGHEIGGHGYKHENAWQLSREAERETIVKAMAALEGVTGERILGWRSAVARPSENTLDLLAEFDFVWRSDFFDHDLPYVIEVGGKNLIEVPYNWSTGDSPLFNWPNRFPYGTPADALSMWKDDFDQLYEESASGGTLQFISLHPFNVGRPSRARALEKFFRYAKGFPGVWFARTIEVARWWIEMGY